MLNYLKGRWLYWRKRNWKLWVVDADNNVYGPFVTREEADEIRNSVSGGRSWYGLKRPTSEKIFKER